MSLTVISNNIRLFQQKLNIDSISIVIKVPNNTYFEIPQRSREFVLTYTCDVSLLLKQ